MIYVLFNLNGHISCRFWSSFCIICIHKTLVSIFTLDLDYIIFVQYPCVSESKMHIRHAVYLGLLHKNDYSKSKHKHLTSVFPIQALLSLWLHVTHVCMRNYTADPTRQIKSRHLRLSLFPFLVYIFIILMLWRLINRWMPAVRTKKHDSLSCSAWAERASNSAEQPIERHEQPKRSVGDASTSLALYGQWIRIFNIIFLWGYHLKLL